jgi:hypothetical protein
VLRRGRCSARSLGAEQESEEAPEWGCSLGGGVEREPVVIQAQPAPLVLPAPMTRLRQKVEQIRALLEIELPAGRCGPFCALTSECSRAYSAVQPSVR